MKMRSFTPGIWCLSLMLCMPLAHAGAFESCPTDNSHTTDPAKLKKILEYKKSDHELVTGYFRMGNDKANVDNSQQKDLTKPKILNNPDKKVALTDIPDCLDMVMAFMMPAIKPITTPPANPPPPTSTPKKLKPWTCSIPVFSWLIPECNN